MDIGRMEGGKGSKCRGMIVVRDDVKKWIDGEEKLRVDRGSE